MVARRSGGCTDARLLPGRGYRGPPFLALPARALRCCRRDAALVHARDIPMSTSIPAYAEFAVQSNFSFLRGASRPEELVVAAKFYGYAAMGLADRNTVAGVVRAWSQSKLIRQESGEGVQLRYHPGRRPVFFDRTPAGPARPEGQQGGTR